METKAEETHGDTCEAESTWRVLIVEDNDGLRGLLKTHLEGRGFDVCEARDAAEAHREMKECQIGAVLMDVFLPGEISGVTLAARFRKASKFLPVIFMTSTKDHPGLFDEDWLDKNGEHFFRKATARLRDEMARYIAACEQVKSNKVVNQLVTTVAKLVKNDTINGAAIAEHGAQLSTYSTVWSKWTLLKIVGGSLLSAATTLGAGLWYVTKDIVRADVANLHDVAAMKQTLDGVKRTVESMVVDKQLERQEKIALTGTLKRIEKNMPSVAPSPAAPTNRSRNEPHFSPADR